MLQAYVGQGLVPVGEATVSVFDRGFRAGEGVFETFRVYGRHVFRLDAHLDRAHEGAAALGFDAGPRGRLRDACIVTARNNSPHLGDDSVLRLTVTPGAIDPASPFPGTTSEGPTLVVTSHRLALPTGLHDQGVRALTVPWRRELPRVKTVSYVASALARRQAQAGGADEALFTDVRRGLVLEGSASNLFAVVGGALVTPPAAEVLGGVTRAVVLEAAAAAGIEVVERALGLEELLSSDEAFLTATTREVVPLVVVDGHTVGEGAPGPLTRRLHAAYRRAVADEVAAGPQEPSS